MVSWSDEATSFRNLVTSKAGAGFVLCITVTLGFVIALTRGVTTTDSVLTTVAFVTLVLTFLCAYLLRREDLMWVVTRPAVAGFAIVIGAGVLGGIAGHESGGETYVQDTVLGLIALIGAGLVFAVIPAVVAMIALMAIHGAGGRSEGPEPFPEE